MTKNKETHLDEVEIIEMNMEGVEQVAAGQVKFPWPPSPTPPPVPTGGPYGPFPPGGGQPPPPAPLPYPKAIEDN
jgi:hypothetical protein